jgi:queuosine precursor transporter
MNISFILKNKVNVLFLILASFFITNTLIAEFVGVKIFSLESTFGWQPFNFSFFGTEGLGFNLTAGVLLWPVVFVMTDIINEYYGPKSVRFLSFLAIGLIIYAFIMVYGTIQLWPNEWWQYEAGKDESHPFGGVLDMNYAYQKIMGQGLWIIAGSMVAFLIGQLVDVFVFHRIKKITGEKKVWLRATGSTLVSQFIDSFVVLFIAFWIGTGWDFVLVLAIGTVNYLYKFAVAIIMTPVIYLAHHMIDRYLGEEVSTRIKNEAAGVEIDFTALSN